MNWKNKLYFGDNLDILREHVADESVDLIYLDPPFNSNANYMRSQTLTIAELLEGKKILHPEHRVETFAKAERKSKHQQEPLF
jgi:16S rRNA G966 N2-methylase RsmD